MVNSLYKIKQKKILILEMDCARYGLSQWSLPNGLQRIYGIYLAFMHSA